MPDSLLQALLTVHIIGFVYWLGGLLGTSWLLVARNAEADMFFRKTIGTLGRRLAMLADVGATLAIATGVTMLVKYKVYEQPWMHIKLTLVVVLLGVHGLVRAKAKRGSNDEKVRFPAFVPMLIGLLTAGIAYLVMFKPLAK